MLNNMDSTAKTSNILDQWDLKQSQFSSLFSWKQSRGLKLAPGLWFPGRWCGDGGDLSGGRAICALINEMLGRGAGEEWQSHPRSVLQVENSHKREH